MKELIIIQNSNDLIKDIKALESKISKIENIIEAYGIEIDCENFLQKLIRQKSEV